MNFNDVYLNLNINRYTIENGPFCLKVLNRNINKTIQKYELIVMPGNGIDIRSFLIKLCGNEFITYSIYYSLNSDKEKFIPLFIDISGDTNINLTSFNIIDDRIYCFKIMAPYFNLASENTLILFRGNVYNNSLINVYLKENNNVIKHNKVSIYISDIFSMNLKLESYPKLLNCNLIYFYYKLTIDSNNGILKNPIVGILLPFNLEKYYMNEEKYEIINLDNNTSIFNIDNEFDKSIIPSINIINNFKNTSRILVKYTFNNYILPPNYILNIYIKVSVNFNNDVIAHAYGFNNEICYDSYINKIKK